MDTIPQISPSATDAEFLLNGIYKKPVEVFSVYKHWTGLSFQYNLTYSPFFTFPSVLHLYEGA